MLAVFFAIFFSSFICSLLFCNFVWCDIVCCTQHTTMNKPVSLCRLFLRTCTRIKSIHQIRWTSERAKKCLYLFFLSFFSWMLAQHDSHRKKNRWRKKFNNIKYRYIYCLCEKREKQRRERIRSTQFVIARCQFPQGNRFRCMMIMFHHVPHSLHIIFVCAGESLSITTHLMWQFHSIFQLIETKNERTLHICMGDTLK